jgi:hypothetical protein
MMIAAWGAFRELNSEGVKPSSSGGVSGICPGGHALAHTMMSTSRIDGVSQSAGVERSSQSSTEPAREFDDGFDFPPTAHPGRELFTSCFFVQLIMAFVIWGGWKLISLILG